MLFLMLFFLPVIEHSFDCSSDRSFLVVRALFFVVLERSFPGLVQPILYIAVLLLREVHGPSPYQTLLSIRAS